MSEPVNEPVNEGNVLQTFTLEQFQEKLAVVRLGPGAEVPDWAESSSLFSVTATAQETSLVCAARSVPKLGWSPPHSLRSGRSCAAKAAT